MNLKDLLETNIGLLKESSEGEKATVLKAKRIMKFSLKNGENSLGVDLKNMKCEFFGFGWLIYIGKPGSLKTGVGYDFENDEKPGFMAYRNGRLGAYQGFKFKKAVSTYDEFLKLLKEHRAPVIIIDPDLTKGAKPVEKAAEPEGEKEFYGLGEWGDPYHKGGEYFLVGPYETKALAKQAVDRRHKNGQPQGFRDWVPGAAKVFDSGEKANAAIKKLKLKEIDFSKADADIENPVMWRLREV